MSAQQLVGRVQYVTMGAWISPELRKEQAARLRRVRASEGGREFLGRLIRLGGPRVGVGGFKRGGAL